MACSSREMIKAHLELSYQVHRGAKAIFDNLIYNKNLIYVSQEYNIEFSALKFKLNILQQKDDYLKEKSKFANAIHDFFYNNVPLNDAGRKYGIDSSTLFKENIKYLRSELNKKTYIYDKLPEKDRVFTFVEESLLLEELHCWIKDKDCQCSCEVCAMEQLQNIAYRFAQQKNKQCPQTWLECRKADLSWLYNFIINYTEEIYRFNTANKCKVDYQSSSSTFYENISEPSTSQTNLQEVCKPSQVVNVNMDIFMRQKIKKHLKANEHLDKAAKEVLLRRKKNNIIEKIAEKYNLTYLLLKTKINILQLREETFQIKYKRESAINDIIFNRISTAHAAKKHEDDESTLTLEITDVWPKSESGIYVYDPPTDYKKIFTFSEEFVLLKRLLRMEPKDLNRNCNCRICLLEHLSRLAYEFAKQNNKRYPSEWNRREKADVTWLLEFEMRHSIEIAKDRSYKCSAEKALASTSV